MPPKRGKKGKRRGDSSSDDEASAAAAAVAASLTAATLYDSDGEGISSRGGKKAGPTPQASAAGKKAKGKKKGRGKRDDSDSDDGDTLDPLAHLKAGGRKGALRGDDSDNGDSKPKKPLTKKEKRRLEEERRRQEKDVVDEEAGEEQDEDEDDDEKSQDAEEEQKAAGEDTASVVDGVGDDEPAAATESETASKPSRKEKRAKKGKKGQADDSDQDPEDEAATSVRKKPLTKKERRRMEEEERLQRELEAAAASDVSDEEVEGDDKKLTPTTVNLDRESAVVSSAEKSNAGKKGSRKGKKGRHREDADDDQAQNDDAEGALSRGMESLSVVEDDDSLPASAVPRAKLTKKERRKAEAAALAAAAAAADEPGGAGGDDEAGEDGEDSEGGAAAEREASSERRAEEEAKAAEARALEEEAKLEQERLHADKAARKAAKKAAKAKGIGEDEGEAGEDEDDGQKRRMSKKERKKAKQEGAKNKGPPEETPQPTAPEAPTSKEDTASAALPPAPPTAAIDETQEEEGTGNAQASGHQEERAESREDAPIPKTETSAPAAGSASPPESKEGKKPKKEKKSKLMRKLEEAKRLKAETEAAAGVVKGDDGKDEKRAAAEAEAERQRKEEKKARKAKKEAAKEKDAKVKSILEDMDDADYYGSDHEERNRKGLHGGAPKETVEQELARLVAAAEEKSGKSLTARQRKKILQDVEARRRAAAEEEREELAHREGAQFGCSQTAVSASDQQWANSLDITIEAFSISAHDKTLFKDSSLQVVHGRKYGLVGPNGAGKSTLLKMIASGELKIPPRIDCLYVEQEVVADDTPAVIAVMKADKARWSLMEEERRVNRLLREDPENDKLNERLQQVHEELHTSGGDGAEAQARRILFGLGFDDIMQVKATKHFSGGWRMRISLARALFMEPTLLMLDEPTNHLDLNAVIWLDDYLQKWKKTLLVVSHDQDFLNSVCEEILHLDHQRVNQYKGNYDQFKEMEAQKRKQQAKEWEKQQRRLAALKKGGQSKGKAEETVKKSKFREPGGSKKKKNDAVAAGTGEVEAATLVERPREYVVTLHFPEVSTLSPPVIEVQDVDFKYATGPTILKNVNFGLDQSSRICIVGPNGAGKTTLLKLLTGALEPTEGYIRRNPRMRAGIYNQHFVDRLPMDIDPTSYLRSKFSDQCDYQTARNLLGRFGLEGHAHTIKMRDLSGGQKARVVFCELSLQAPHVLFLDEPTNNLDIESIDALCTAVTEFNGGVVVVTHDARLIEATECRLWIVDEQEVTPWQGEFEEYRADLLQKMEDKLAEQEQARAAKASV